MNTLKFGNKAYFQSHMWTLGFIQFRWLDALDILLVAILLYELYKLIKGSVAINIFLGILSVYLFWLIVKALNMQLLGTILGQFIGVGVIALIVVFQQEMRRFLLLIGTNGFLTKTRLRLFEFGKQRNKTLHLDVETIVKACKNMSETKTGAIIVLTTNSDLKFYINTGDSINARLSLRLLESIFFKNNPLHDGAVIIAENTIKAARCVLPVTEDPDFPANLGMRHRAAVGISEVSDAVTIIVSEQTGEISVAKEGLLKTNLSPEKLTRYLDEIFN